MRTKEEMITGIGALRTVIEENPFMSDVERDALICATTAAITGDDSIYNDYEMPPLSPLREAMKVKYGNRTKKGTRENENRRRDYSLRWKYGITLEDYQALMIAQYFSCAICKQAFETTSKGRRKNCRPHVDHRHSDGKVRGLLCGSCNRGLGYFQDDSNIAQAAAEYLQKHS